MPHANQHGGILRFVTTGSSIDLGEHPARKWSEASPARSGKRPCARPLIARETIANGNVATRGHSSRSFGDPERNPRDKI
eukprot:748767-Amphidinium_carterae.1